MGNSASTIAGTIESWLGGIAAHLLALIIAPIINQVRQQHPPPAQMDDLVTAVNGLSEQVVHLREDLAARHEPFVYEMAIRAVPRPRPRPRPPFRTR